MSGKIFEGCRGLLFGDRRWKGYDFDVLNQLDEKKYIRQGSHQSKSIYITKEGEAKAKN